MMLEVLAFPSDTNDVVNSLETTERKIKEFERHHELAQDSSDERQPSRKDPRVLPKVLARNRIRRSCVSIARRKVIELPNVARSKRTTTVESRSVPKKKKDSKGKNNKKEFKSKCYKCGKIGHTSKDLRSKETSAIEAGDELTETGCIEMASIDLNALEIGAVQEFVLGSIRVLQ